VNNLEKVLMEKQKETTAWQMKYNIKATNAQ